VNFHHLSVCDRKRPAYQPEVRQARSSLAARSALQGESAHRHADRRRGTGDDATRGVPQRAFPALDRPFRRAFTPREDPGDGRARVPTPIAAEGFSRDLLGLRVRFSLSRLGRRFEVDPWGLTPRDRETRGEEFKPRARASWC
jgi:hypothetical protein